MRATGGFERRKENGTGGKKRKEKVTNACLRDSRERMCGYGEERRTRERRYCERKGLIRAGRTKTEEEKNAPTSSSVDVLLRLAFALEVTATLALVPPPPTVIALVLPPPPPPPP
jgi:hypothetical protein